MEEMKKIVPAKLLPVLKEVLESEDPKNMVKIEKDGDKYKINMNLGAEKNFQYFNNEWEMRDGDVLLVSFPKTGTNWVTEVVDRVLVQDLDEFQKLKSIPLTTRVLEMTIPKKFEIWDNLPFKRRLFLTHMTSKMFDMNRLKKKNIKIIYVLRNPKDTLVSMYNFLKKLPPFQAEPLKGMVHNGWSNFYTSYMNGCLPMTDDKDGSYINHILTWFKYKKDFGIHYVYYEDMKKDFKGGVKALAKHLDVPITNEKLEEISSKCTIDSMRKSYQERSGLQSKHATAFINKGGVGGWKDYFTVSQSEEWDKLVKESLSNTDVKFHYTI